jgi:hypothetical protein
LLTRFERSIEMSKIDVAELERAAARVEVPAQ